jgi:hypothetical protein
MSQRAEPPDPTKKKTNVVLIVVIVVVILVLIIVGVVIWLIIWLRRRAQRAINCKTDADCLLDFKCNKNTGVCSQCLTDADCTGGKTCTGVVCACPLPVITNATVTITQAWPPIIEVFVDSTGGSYATNKYKIVFTNSAGTFTSPSDFIANPGDTAPTFTFELPGTCDDLSMYSGYGCETNCGPGHSVSGKVSIQVQNECGSISATKVVPVSGNCDFCSATTC